MLLIFNVLSWPAWEASISRFTGSCCWTKPFLGSILRVYSGHSCNSCTNIICNYLALVVLTSAHLHCTSSYSTLLHPVGASYRTLLGYASPLSIWIGFSEKVRKAHFLLLLISRISSHLIVPIQVFSYISSHWLTRRIIAGVLHIRDHFIPGIDSGDHSFTVDWES
jgi:hypothetical protein